MVEKKKTLLKISKSFHKIVFSVLTFPGRSYYTAVLSNCRKEMGSGKLGR